MFRYAFPFEGNWNPNADIVGFLLIPGGSDTLSRLKGIETVFSITKGTSILLSGSDTLSRLKGIETIGIVPTTGGTLSCSDTLSRLKGIETRPLSWRWVL